MRFHSGSNFFDIVNSLEINGLIQNSFKRFQFFRLCFLIFICKSCYFWKKINLQNVVNENKKIYLLFCLLLTATFNHAYGTVGLDNHGGNILIREGTVNGFPRGDSIQAELDGHWLYVTFIENLGIVTVEVLDSCGNEALSVPTPTPNGVNFYIPYAGSYMVVII